MSRHLCGSKNSLHKASLLAGVNLVLTARLVNDFIQATEMEPYYRQYSGAYGTRHHQRALKLEK